MSYYQEGHELLQFSQDVILCPFFFAESIDWGGQMSLRTRIHRHRRHRSGHLADLELFMVFVLQTCACWTRLV